VVAVVEVRLLRQELRELRILVVVAVVVVDMQATLVVLVALGVQVLSFFVTPIPFRLQHLLPVLQP
jgi:hypothetical protein